MLPNRHIILAWNPLFGTRKSENLQGCFFTVRSTNPDCGVRAESVWRGAFVPRGFRFYPHLILWNEAAEKTALKFEFPAVSRFEFFSAWKKFKWSQDWISELPKPILMIFGAFWSSISILSGKIKFMRIPRQKTLKKSTSVIPIFSDWDFSIKIESKCPKSVEYRYEMPSKPLFCCSKSFSIIVWCLEDTFQPKIVMKLSIWIHIFKTLQLVVIQLGTRILKLSRWGLTMVFWKLRIWYKIQGNPSLIDFILGAEMFPEAWNTIWDQFKQFSEWFRANIACQNMTFRVLELEFSEFPTWDRSLARVGATETHKK